MFPAAVMPDGRALRAFHEVISPYPMLYFRRRRVVASVDKFRKLQVLCLHLQRARMILLAWLAGNEGEYRQPHIQPSTITPFCALDSKAIRNSQPSIVGPTSTFVIQKPTTAGHKLVTTLTGRDISPYMALKAIKRCQLPIHFKCFPFCYR